MEKISQEQQLGQDFTFAALGKFIAPSIFTFVFISLYQMMDGFFIRLFAGEIVFPVVYPSASSSAGGFSSGPSSK